MRITRERMWSHNYYLPLRVLVLCHPIIGELTTYTISFFLSTSIAAKNSQSFVIEIRILHKNPKVHWRDFDVKNGQPQFITASSMLQGLMENKRVNVFVLYCPGTKSCIHQSNVKNKQKTNGTKRKEMWTKDIQVRKRKKRMEKLKENQMVTNNGSRCAINQFLSYVLPLPFVKMILSSLCMRTWKLPIRILSKLKWIELNSKGRTLRILNSYQFLNNCANTFHPSRSKNVLSHFLFFFVW